MSRKVTERQGTVTELATSIGILDGPSAVTAEGPFYLRACCSPKT
jgi:hypothetical protein